MTMQHDDLGPVGETKPWYASKGVIGSGIAAVAIVGGFFGVSIDQQTQNVVADQATAFVVAGTALVGTVIGIYGRFVAKKAIG